MKYLSEKIAFVLLLVCFMSASAQLERTGTPVSWNQGLTLSIENEWLSEANVPALLQEDELSIDDRSVPYRFAYAKEVNWNMVNSGSWTNLANGDRIWILGITYEGAQSIAVTLGDLQIPKGGKLFLYSESHQECLGPLSEEDNSEQPITLPHIQGSTIFMEYYEPRLYRGEGSLSVNFVAGSYRNNLQDFETLHACNEWIHDDEFFSDDTPIQSSVVQVLTDYGQRYATAVMVNNSANDGKPYVILPAHALLGDPSSLLFRFGYTEPSCIESLSNCNFQFVCGAEVIVVDDEKGLALVELTKPPKSDWAAYYAGWHIGDYLYANHYCIQHPKGLVKSYSHYVGNYMPVILEDETFMGLPGLGHGQTDGGSVGSPLFDEDLDLVGIFVGGNTRCGTQGGIDRFILLEDVWSAFGKYLNPLQQSFERLPGMELPDPIVEGDNPMEMLIYPNPASSYVELACGEDFTVYSLFLYNSVGTLEMFESGKSKIDVSQLNEGVYALRAHTSKGSFSKTLLVTKK